MVWACRECESTFKQDPHACPHCGSVDIEVIRGK
jgi:RNA polymerase subunit RPABC4/transcription elongation factor Spt4